MSFKNDKNKPKSPPLMIYFYDNYYIDKQPVNNFSYKEYLDFLKNNFGTESMKYKAMLPKTIKCLKDTVIFDYFNNSSFLVLPVLGLTKNQVLAYTKWRQDRVLEFQLFKRKMVPKLNDTFFTTENYFNGKVPGSRLDKKFQYFEFSLPSAKQLQYIDVHNNKKNKKHFFMKKYNSFVATDGERKVPVHYLDVKGKDSKKCILKWDELLEYDSDSQSDYELKTFRNIAKLKRWSEK